MLHGLLWQLNSEITRRCLEHPFVRGLADDHLHAAEGESGAEIVGVSVLIDRSGRC